MKLKMKDVAAGLGAKQGVDPCVRLVSTPRRVLRLLGKADMFIPCTYMIVGTATSVHGPARSAAVDHSPTLSPLIHHHVAYLHR